MSIIVLTAGHSSTDPGACSGGYTEAGLMLELRDVTAEMLRDMGHVVIEDGGDGENMPLRHAISLIGQGAIALELHTNASDNPGDPARFGIDRSSRPRHARACRAHRQHAAQGAGLGAADLAG